MHFKRAGNLVAIPPKTAYRVPVTRQSPDAEAHYYPIFRHSDAQMKRRRAPFSPLQLPIIGLNSYRSRNRSRLLYAIFPCLCSDAIDTRSLYRSHFRGYFRVLSPVSLVVSHSPGYRRNPLSRRIDGSLPVRGVLPVIIPFD